MKPYHGGKPDIPLKNFCERFQFQKAEEFHGFLTPKGKGVLYHHGSVSPRKRRDAYLRCEWKFPFGQQDNSEHFEHILFHVPPTEKYGCKESFVLVSKSSYENYCAKYPIFRKTLNLSAAPEKWKPQRKYLPFKRLYFRQESLSAKIDAIDDRTIDDDVVPAVK